MPNTILKRWNGTAFEELYPKTTVGQISASGTPSSTTFLRGDGQWATPTDVDTNNYLTGVSGSGNGTVTFTRQGLSNLTWDASHTHTFASLTSKPTTLSGFGITDGIPYNDVLMPTNPFGGKKLYINSIDNAMHSADKKWYVTATRHLKVYNSVTYPILNTGYRSIYTYTTANNITFTLDQTPLPTNVVVFLNISAGGTRATQVASAPSGNTQYTYNNTTGAIVFGAARPDSTIYVYAHPDVPQYTDSPSLGSVSASTFFDGDYEGGISIATTEYLKIRITPGNNVLTDFSSSIGYPYGSVYLSHYYDGAAETEYLRTYNYSYAAQGIGWKQVTFSNFVNDNTNVNFISQAANDGDFGRSVMEIIVVSKSAKAANLNEIDWRLSRPSLSSSGSTVTKFGQNKLYNNLLFGQQTTLMELSGTNGWIRTSDNSAAAPAFSFINDTDTGMFRPAADTLAFAEGGSEVIRITSNGRVGIGATVPNQLLHVGGAINLHSQITWFNGNADINGADTNLKFRTYTGSALTEKMIITSAGNVGVGTNNPLTRFVISTNNENFEFGPASVTYNGGTIEYINRTSGSTRPDMNFFNSQGAIKFFTGGANERLRIANNGNVGIGTTSPNQLFEVKGSGLTYAKVSSATNGSFRGVGFGIENDATVYGSVAMEMTNGQMRFQTGFAGWGGFQTFFTNGSERMRITDTGNVGIGTTAPAVKLHVAGATRIVGQLNIMGDAETKRVWVDYEDGNDMGTIQAVQDGVAYKNLALQPDGNNVGIGTRSPGEKLEVNGVTKATSFTSTVATGTAPLTVTSTTVALNLNADLLDGQHGSYYAPLASPALTGTPTAPTATAGTNTTQIATTAFVSTAVANLINAAPGALDTLDELAAALGDDASFATTVTNSLAGKLSLSGGTMTLSSGTTSNGIFFNTAQTFTGPQIRGKVQELYRDYYLSSYKIWDEGNDGAGSTLDADLLDGNHASAFALASHTHAATDITSGTIATARLASGTANTTTFLRGDSTWSSAGIATYSTATLYVKRIWSRTIATGSTWTSRYNAGTGAGTAISTTSTFTTIALGYTPASTDQFMIEFSNNTSDSLEKGICIVGGGTFSSTAGMSVISYDAYETVDASQLKIAKYYAQWYITGTSLGFRYGSKMVW